MNLVKQKNTHDVKKVVENVPAKPICQKLKALRIRLGYETPKAFAGELGVKYTTYLNYEEKRLPPSEFLFLIKRKFGKAVSIDNLLGDSKNCAEDFALINEPTASYGGQKHKKLVEMTVTILETDSDYAKHLATTIKLCYEAMKMKADITVPFKKSTGKGVM